MDCYIEYLGRGVVMVNGVGELGRDWFDRKTKKFTRKTKAKCSKSVAQSLLKDKRFMVHGLIAEKPKNKEKNNAG